MGWCIQKQNSLTRATGIVTISIKILLEVNVGKSILDSSKYEEVIKGQQKSHNWNRVRLTLRGENIIRKLSFPSSDALSKSILLQISKRKLKKEYTIFSATGKNTTSYTLSSILNLEGQTRYLTFLGRRTVKLYKN